MEKIDFIDLFAGIGGTRLGVEAAAECLGIQAECVFSSEWDKFAQITYEANFDEKPVGDIREISTDDIPNHQMLLAGFPCQPFSIAGVSKKNALGREHGFRCKTQGTLFFEIQRILEDVRPRFFILENVKNLLYHDGGETFKVINEVLNEELDYRVFFKLYNSQPFVPQHRERLFFIGFRDEKDARSFEPPEVSGDFPKLGSILEKSVDSKYTLSDHLWDYLQAYREKHRKKGNGFGYNLYGPDDVAGTLSARYYKDGAEILIKQRGKNPRRLTPRECARLMGFPDSFRIPVSDTQAYRQFGNSIVVPLVTAVSEAVLRHMAAIDGDIKETATASERIGSGYSCEPGLPFYVI
ncbi:MAG: DNA (cytosine-5-)-methyltransferase [Mesotoga sp.]|uniref:DNA (cytosine-5-)-methyltransferase n=1 Tax=Mesotoga sp. TaxID=2053577 RepID=UPI003565734F